VERTEDTNEVELARLLDRSADARVGVFDRNAARLDTPPWLDLHGQGELPSGPLLELIVAADRPAVVAAWEHVRTTGSAQSSLRLVDGRVCHGHLYDLAPAHDVIVLAIVMDSADAGPSVLDDLAPAPAPRLSRMRKDELSVILEADPAAQMTFGWPAEALVGRRTLELIHPEDHQRGIRSWLEMLGAPGLTHRWKGRHLCADGSYRWMEFVNTNQLAEAEGSVLCEMIDISEEMAAREALVASEQLLKGLAEALPLGVAQLDPAGDVVFANLRVATTLGIASPRSLADVCQHVAAWDRDRLELLWRDLLEHAIPCEAEFELRDGRSVELVLRPLLAGDDGGLTGAVLCVSDVSQRVRARRDLERRARIDPLTQVLNRHAIEGELTVALAERTSGVAVVFIDVNAFKSVNDELGHSAGDAALTEVGSRLRSVVRVRGDQVGRVGGDEFMVVCAGVNSMVQAQELRARVDDRLHTPPPMVGDRFLSASVGVAWSGDPEIPAAELVRRADEDMYRVKRSRALV
jgi:diguanylate cyclase (GGDEF)-like protein/PAS domain S-box-containing protein